MKCPKCSSNNVKYLGYHSTLIAIDEFVDWFEYECVNCNYGWLE